MSLQLHRPDGKGGLEPRAVTDENWHNQLRSPRWGASLKGGKLPRLANPEMNPTSTARSVAFWVALGVITFAIIVVGYGSSFFAYPPTPTAAPVVTAAPVTAAPAASPAAELARSSRTRPKEPDRRRHRPGATMQRALIASGVLGLGTALVFGAAAVTASLFPNGATVAASFNGGDMMFAQAGHGRDARADAAPARVRPARCRRRRWRRRTGRRAASHHRARPHGLSARPAALIGVAGAPAAPAGGSASPPYTQPAMRLLSQFFDTNDRELDAAPAPRRPTNELEDEFAALSDDEIRERIDVVRAEIAEDAAPEEPSEDELHHPELERRNDLAKARRKRDKERLQAVLDDMIPEVFAAGREAMKRTMGMRQYDVQLMGAIVLHQGRIAEMRTGEGKTLIPTLAAVLNGLAGRGAHVVTVNDYLARRDAQWMGPAFHFLGLSVGVITHDTSYLFEPGFPTTDERLINLRPVTRREAYEADITYGTNNEFGFDYLRDNMVDTLEGRVQRERSFAIVDEVDNILIDEARTPLIISGQAEESADLYFTFARLVPKLQPRPEGAEEGGDYFVDLKDKAVSPTEEGVDKIEKLLGIENLYDADPRLARHFDSALKAHALYKRDRDYIVEDGEIVIVDEFTGRKMPGRRWSEGLHQAVEAKEGLRVQRESRTLATITFQNYFRLYDKLAGMTGTAMTEAEEFHKIYTLEVVAIPTHRPMIRDDYAGPRVQERDVASSTR